MSFSLVKLLQSYREAAVTEREKGHAAAQFIVGVMYNIGERVPQDSGEEARWYRLATDQGHAAA